VRPEGRGRTGRWGTKPRRQRKAGAELNREDRGVGQRDWSPRTGRWGTKPRRQRMVGAELNQEDRGVGPEELKPTGGTVLPNRDSGDKSEWWVR